MGEDVGPFAQLTVQYIAHRLSIMLHIASRHKPLLAVIPIAMLLLAPPARAATPAPFELSARLSKADFSGSVLVKDGAKVLYRKDFGLADRGFGVPVASGTRFPVASITKLVTAAAVLKLAEEGKLALDDPFRRHLSDYPGPGADAITIRQLLGHMSGLPQFDTVASLEEALANGLPQYQRPRTSRQLLELCCSAAPARPPGKAFDYNNADYIVLGQLIEAVTGESYAAAAERLVLAPAGARDTALMRWDQVTPRLARTYFRPPGAAQFGNDLPVFWENWYAAGGLYSTVDDVTAFAEALFDGRLLRPASMTALLTVAGDEYGLGLWSYSFVRGGTRYRVAKRPGSIMGANAVLYRLLDRRLTIVVLANSNAIDLDGLAQDTAEAVIDGRRIR